MEYRELAEKSGIVHWRRVPALNTDERFIADMADMVIEALESPALSVSEAASQNAEFLVEKTAVASQLGLTMQGTHLPFHSIPLNLIFLQLPLYHHVLMTNMSHPYHWWYLIQSLSDWCITDDNTSTPCPPSLYPPILLPIAAEMLNGRLAMMGILGTTVFEIISGHPVVQMVGLR